MGGMAAPNFRHAHWIKSSFSEPDHDCVELAAGKGRIGLRDSKLGDASPVLVLTPAAFAAFLDSLRPPGAGAA